MSKFTVPFAGILIAASVGLAFAQSGSGSYGSSTPGKSGMSSATSAGNAKAADKSTGCKTTASKEEKGKQGAVANSSSHNAATTGTNVAGKPQTGC